MRLVTKFNNCLIANQSISFPLQHMVMSFRVSELQVLLGYAGRNKSGRKHELQTRGLTLLKSGCSTSVQIKIRELYRRRFPRRLINPPQFMPGMSEGSGSGSTCSNSTTGTSHHSSSSSNPPLPSYPGTMNIHQNVPHELLGGSCQPQPFHPDVKLKLLPFYDVLGELVKPTGLSKLKRSIIQWNYYLWCVIYLEDTNEKSHYKMAEKSLYHASTFSFDMK